MVYVLAHTWHFKGLETEDLVKGRKMLWRLWADGEVDFTGSRFPIWSTTMKPHFLNAGLVPDKRKGSSSQEFAVAAAVAEEQAEVEEET